MNIETLEKANSLQREIDSVNTELRELQDGCGIQVTKKGKVYIKVNDGWASKDVPDWFAKKINEALNQYRNSLTIAMNDLLLQLKEL